MTDNEVITALNTVLTQLDSDNTSGRMLLDFSSACNTVTEKPSNLGLGSSLCMWKRDFLSNKAKNTQMGMYTLSILILNTSTLQGCVLSPLLYSILTHGCSPIHPTDTSVKICDDTTLIRLILDNNTADREEFQHLTNCSQFVFRTTWT